MTTSSDMLAGLVRVAASAQFKDLPEAAVARAKASILDSLACGLAGGETEQVQAVRQYVIGQSASAQARIWAGGQTTSFYAAMTNSMMMRVSGLAEGYDGLPLRPASVIVPALIAVGDRERATGSDLLVAAAVGYEVMLRIARAIGPGLAELGLDVNVAAGALGAAAAASRLMQFDAAGMHNALGLAAAQLPTAPAGVDDALLVAGFFDGQAAATGVMAAELVRIGMTGLGDWTERWLTGVPRGADLAVLSGAGSRWLMTEPGIQTMIETPAPVTDVTAEATSARRVGTPSPDASFDVVAAKTRALVKSILPLARYETLIGSVRALEKLDNVRTLTALIGPQAGTHTSRTA